MLHATLLDSLFSVGCSGSKHAIRRDSQESYFKLSGSAECTDLLKYIYIYFFFLEARSGPDAFESYCCLGEQHSVSAVTALTTVQHSIDCIILSFALSGNCPT